MTENLMIGDLARLTGRSVHAIRWYERQGLIPNVTRDSGGRRVYHPDHVDWLLFLQRLKETGMTISTLRDYANLALKGHKSITERCALLQQHRSLVENQIKDLHQALEMIDAKIAFYGDWSANKKQPSKIPGSPDFNVSLP